MFQLMVTVQGQVFSRSNLLKLWLEEGIVHTFELQNPNLQKKVASKFLWRNERQ